MKIGVVGYSHSNFDVNEAFEKLRSGIKRIIKDYDFGANEIEIVSGYTDYGIPALTYRIADKIGFKTVGFACSQAEDMDVYPVDEYYIIGDDWGDESEEFLKYIDVLLRVGGGEQSFREAKMFRKKYGNEYVYEYNLKEK